MEHHIRFDADAMTLYLLDQRALPGREDYLPIRTLEDFRKMQPQNKLFPGLLTAHPGASVHPLCLETLSPDCQLHGRHFSAGDSGVTEDDLKSWGGSITNQGLSLIHISEPTRPY